MELREQETGYLLFQLPTETKNFDRPIFLRNHLTVPLSNYCNT